MLRVPGLLFLLLILTLGFPPRTRAEPVPPCEECPEKGWPLVLLPGDLRVALPSPDGRMLAVLGGPGIVGREHTVLLLERDCERGLTQQLTLSSSAVYTPTPKEVPAPYVHLQWSPDGSKLLAADAVYGIGHDREGNLTAKELRKVTGPFLDFRFGPPTRAAAVRVVEAGRRDLRGDGRQLFRVLLEYNFVSLTRPVDTPIPPREERGVLWVVAEWEEPPRMEWEPGGAVLIYYPYNRITERFQPGRMRDVVEGVMPGPPQAEGLGPFRFTEPCPTTWTLDPSGKSTRVRLELQ